MKTKTIILIAVLVIVVGSIYIFESQKVKPINYIDTSNKEVLDGESQYVTAPELVGVSGYINTEKIKISDLKGKVVLIDFWTYSCINCIRTLPYLTAWDKKYRDKGLVIIGVHTPEFEFEKEYENVLDATKKYNIEYPVVQDNDYAIWQAYKNRFWPRKYLIDKDGFIRYDHIGEGGYEETELKIQELLAEIGEDVTNIKTEDEEKKEYVLKTTPELYSGYDFAISRGQNIGNAGGMKVGQIYSYSKPLKLKEDTIYLEGTWKSNSDNLELTGNDGSVFLNYKAGEVNIVSESAKLQQVEILIDGAKLSGDLAGKDVNFLEGNAYVQIQTPQLYNIINGNYGNHVIELKVKKGFSFHAFTFGS
jgi:thiol-disulfide isomerase/thioredoxin